MFQQKTNRVLRTLTPFFTDEQSQLLDFFNSHILHLEDIYFFAELQKKEVFDETCASLLRVAPPHILASLQQVEAEMRKLMCFFEKICRAEVDRFREEGVALREQMINEIAAYNEKWREAEQRRQKDFADLSLACQKDVVAITAELRSGVFTYFWDKRMSAVLNGALNEKIEELRVLQSQFEALAELRLTERSESQKLLRAEREKHNQRFLALQEEMTKMSDELTKANELQQQKHLREMLELRRQNAAYVTSLQKEISEEKRQNEIGRKRLLDQLDIYRATVKTLEEEKKKIMSELCKLMTQTEGRHCCSTWRDTQAKLDLTKLQTFANILQEGSVQAPWGQLVEPASGDYLAREKTLSKINSRSLSLASNAKATEQGQSLSERGGSQFFLTGKDLLGKHDFEISEETSTFSNGKRSSVELLCSTAHTDIGNTNGCSAVEKSTKPYVRLLNLSEQLKKHIEFKY